MFNNTKILLKENNLTLFTNKNSSKVTPEIFFIKDHFNNVLRFTTVCDPVVYENELLKVANHLTTFKKNELKIYRKMYKDNSSPEFIQLLDTINLYTIMDHANLIDKKTTIENNYTYIRFLELIVIFNTTLNTIPLQACKGRYFWELINIVRENRIGSLYQVAYLAKSYPWLWILPIWKTLYMYELTTDYLDAKDAAD